MKIYCISGLGADQSVFETLTLKHEKIPVNWVSTYLGEEMSAYAEKLCQQIDKKEPFVLLGVSFGGMLAVEMNKYVKPVKTILISSVATYKELPLWVRMIGRTYIQRILPSFLFTSHPKMVIWHFGIRTNLGKSAIRKILQKQDRAFLKYSIDKVLTWRNTDIPKNLIRIHGDNDKLLPAPSNVDYHVLKKGGHFAIVENATEISTIINRLLQKPT